MIFVDSHAFTKAASSILTESELIELENALVENPEAGDLIKGSGGSRVIYYWYVTPEKIQFCRIYEKSSQANISKAEIKKIKDELE